MPHRLLSNSLSGLIGMVGQKLLNLATTIVLARALHPEEFGVYAFVGAVVFFLGFLTDLGMERVLTRELAANKHEASAWLGTALILKMALGAMAASAGLLVAWILVLDAVSFRCLLLALAALPLGFDVLARAYFQSQLQVAAYYRVSVVGGLSYLLLVTLCWWWQASVVTVFAAGLANACFVAAMFLILVRRHVDMVARWVPSRARALLTEGFQVALLGLLFTVALRVDQVLLFRLRGAEEVAQYAAAVRLTEALSMLPEAVMLTLFPLLAAAHPAEPARFRWRYRTGFRYLAALAVPLALVCQYAASELLWLVFGSAYRPGATAVGILGWNMVFSFLGAVYLNVYLIRSWYHLLLGVSSVCTVVKILLNLAWIPRFGGTGAAVATLVSTALGFLLWLMLPPTRAVAWDCVRESARALLAGAVAIGVVTAMPVADVLSATAGALAVYAVVVVATGGIRSTDVRRLLAA